MLAGAINVRSTDMPALLYHDQGYDPDDVLWGLFQNRTLVRVKFFNVYYVQNC